MVDLTLVTDENVQDIIDTAEYGGITYWATQPNDDEFAGLPEGKEYTIVEGIDDFPFGGREVEAVHYLSKEDIRQAFGRLLALDQPYVNRTLHGYVLEAWLERGNEDGIDCTYIDADAADAIVQVACFDELKYG